LIKIRSKMFLLLYRSEKTNNILIFNTNYYTISDLEKSFEFKLREREEKATLILLNSGKMVGSVKSCGILDKNFNLGFSLTVENSPMLVDMSKVFTFSEVKDLTKEKSNFSKIPLYSRKIARHLNPNEYRMLNRNINITMPSYNKYIENAIKNYPYVFIRNSEVHSEILKKYNDLKGQIINFNVDSNIALVLLDTNPFPKNIFSTSQKVSIKETLETILKKENIEKDEFEMLIARCRFFHITDLEFPRLIKEEVIEEKQIIKNN